ncbi:MAG: endonuclease/exonuclease/phosphatase family protein [Candidatus Promineifilaceae bacterium]
MPEITVATLNLRNRQDRWLKRRELVVAQLLDATPDLISLQEVYRPFGQATWLKNQINGRLGAKAAGRPYRIVQKRRHHYWKGYLEGIAILSRLPILSHDAISLGYEGRVALRANIELPTRETLDFVAVHLHHLARDREARVEQVMLLTGWLNEQNPVPLRVIAGDFNEVPQGPAIQQMKQGYRSAFEERWGHEPVATFPTALVEREDDWAGCLDYIFISPAVESVQKVQIFCDKPSVNDPTLYPSDHVGLLVTLETG